MSMSENFSKVYSQAAGIEGQPAWLENFRENSYQKFLKIGLPTRKNEAWHYSSTKRFSEQTFRLAPNMGVQLIKDQFRKLAAQASDLTLFLINGVVYESGVTTAGVNESIIFKSLRSTVEDTSDDFDFKKSAALSAPHHAAGGFRFLHEFSFLDMLDITVKSSPKTPVIHIIHVGGSESNDGNSTNLVSSRIRLAVEKQASVMLKESFVSYGDSHSFVHGVLDVSLAQGSRLSHVRQHLSGNENRDFLGSSYARLARDAEYKNLNLVISGCWIREQIQIDLLDQGAHAQTDALYLGDDQQHIDFHTGINHLSAHTSSSQLYKSVLGGNSHGVFDGKIKISKGAQQVSAFQLNRNLLMADSARASTKPQMEIDADDVKCSHGATVGQLERDEIFYLQSRGISFDQAQRILAEGFAAEVLSRHPKELLGDVFDAQVKPAIPIPARF